jgi:hypothetical protein
MAIQPVQKGRACRVLVVAPRPLSEERGTTGKVLHVLKVLASAGCEVHVVTSGSVSPVAIDGAVFHRAWQPPGIGLLPGGPSWKRGVLDAILAVRVWTLLAAYRFAVVHAFDEAISFTLPVARLRGAAVIYHLDFLPSGQMAARSLRRSALAITASAALTERVRAVDRRIPIVQIEDRADASTRFGPKLLEAYAAVLAGRRSRLSAVTINM